MQGCHSREDSGADFRNVQGMNCSVEMFPARFPLNAGPVRYSHDPAPPKTAIIVSWTAKSASSDYREGDDSYGKRIGVKKTD
jgi:hypothetical protein